ncbi:MAG: zeta toxin family protein [Verrucomicrobia bacterium]|nr:zeta toxin family protein [Verrucomicrobiota bacterium]
MPDNSPILYLIGGPNGAGKTTFAKQFLPAVGVMEFLNADSLAAGLSPLDPPLAATRAARLLLSRWKELVNGRQSFAFESTLSGRTYATMIRTAKAQGYRLHLSYLYLETVQHSIRRVRERVKKGGHDVPVSDLKRRFLPSLHHFFDLYLPLSDEALLYNFTLQPPPLVAAWRNGKLNVHSPADYESIRNR